MIPGDHLHRNSCGAAFRDRRSGFRTRRIDQADEPNKHETLIDIAGEPPKSSLAAS
jgi:hypothetical protein